MPNHNPNTDGLTPQREGNPALPGAGRKPGRYKQFITLCEADDIDAPSKEDFNKVQAYMLEMTEAELKKLANDPKKPKSLRNLAESLIGERRYDATKDFADRVYGKPVQAQQLTGADGGAISFTLAPADPNQLAGLTIETNAD